MGVGVGRNLLMVFLLWLRWATAPHELLWLLWLGLLWLRPSFLHRWPSLLWRAFNLHSRLVLAPPQLGRNSLSQNGYRQLCRYAAIPLYAMPPCRYALSARLGA